MSEPILLDGIRVQPMQMHTNDSDNGMAGVAVLGMLAGSSRVVTAGIVDAITARAIAADLIRAADEVDHYNAAKRRRVQ